MEYSVLLKLPQTSRKRLARYALVSLGSATLFVPLLEFPVSDPGIPRSIWWNVGVALWFCSLAVLVASVLVGHRISRAVCFYVFEEAAVLPSGLVMLFGGIWMLWGGLGSSSATAFTLGLGAGLVTLPFVVRVRAKWMREAITRGHLSRALNPETAIWDPRYDADHILKDPRLRRPSCLLSLLFWAGPAVGLALADVFGQATTVLIIGVLLAGFGYYLITGGTTNLIVLLAEIRRFERRLGRRVLLPADFTR